MRSSPKTKRKVDATSIRFGARISLALPVLLNVDARMVGCGMIRNASISGGLIETALELPLHTNLVVTLSIPGGEAPATHALAACVVRVDIEGVGVEWRDIAGTDVVELLARASVLTSG